MKLGPTHPGGDNPALNVIGGERLLRPMPPQFAGQEKTLPSRFARTRLCKSNAALPLATGGTR
jgi:hypothetical protein